jgi:steroid delta-isomerase-like uncharacterized protein
MSVDATSVILEWTEAFDRHDPDAYARYFGDDCVFTNVGTGRRLVGRAAARHDFVDLLGAWSDLRLEVVNVLSADAGFTKEWIMTGVHTGDMPDLPATGRPFCIVGAGVGRIRDGRIVGLTEYWNLADFLGQGGRLSAALEPRVRSDRTLTLVCSH